MNSFLFRVAKTYFDHHGSEINQLTFVFPNRRAGLFYQKALAEIAGAPIFSPEIITIEDCFRAASGRQNADKLNMLFQLYNIYLKKSNSDESFDSFVFWGEMLLNDFNEADTYRVNVEQLFTNITELKEIDQLFSYFSEAQIEAIRQFWQNFIPHNENTSQADFLMIWKILLPMYYDLKKILIDENIAYQGMMLREVTDKLIGKESIPWIDSRQFVFIGFNALNPSEKIFIQYLLKYNRADFYWDYESDELRESSNPASMFYAENTHLFPSKYSIEPQIKPLSAKEFQLISIPSAIGQAKQVHHVLRELYPESSDDNDFLKTAIVLPDEQLLMPLLYSIPENINKINITMGFPLSQTPIAGLMDHLYELHKRKRLTDDNTTFYHLNVLAILNHEIIGALCTQTVDTIKENIRINNLIYVEVAELHKHPILELIFNPTIQADNFISYLTNIIRTIHSQWKKISETSGDKSLTTAFMYQYYLTINRIDTILKAQPSTISINMDTLIRIVRQLTLSISVPFAGEPLHGLQLMGVLETRGLDFDNLIIISFNEGVYPTHSYSSSFIPYHLRKGFQLPTFEHQDAITSYNFYRLIHQAKKVFMITDTRSDKGTGEVSRFFHQLHYHYKVPLNINTVVYDINIADQEGLEIIKDASIMKKLEQYRNKEASRKALSATSINTYIKCPLKFYFEYVEELRPKDELTETIETDMFGNIFHEVMANLYAPYKNQIISKEILQQLINNKRQLEQLVRDAFAKYIFKKPKGSITHLEGNHLLVSRIILKYINGVIQKDQNYAPFQYIDGEKFCEATLQTSIGEVNLKGFIDRIDEKDGRIRILDYKTGSGELEFKSWESVFSADISPEKRPKHVLQTFLYGYLYKQFTANQLISPGIYYTRKVFHKDFSTELIYNSAELKGKKKVNNYLEYEKPFVEGLRECIEEMMDVSIPFRQTKVHDACKFCDFTTICKR